MWFYLITILIVAAFIIYNTRNTNEKFNIESNKNDEIKKNIKEIKKEQLCDNYVRWKPGRRMFDSLTYDFNDVL